MIVWVIVTLICVCALLVCGGAAVSAYLYFRHDWSTDKIERQWWYQLCYKWAFYVYLTLGSALILMLVFAVVL